MKELIDNIVSNAVTYLQLFGIVGGFFLILLESIIPALPLGVFVALNMIAFGNVAGFIISWTATICGCLLSYLLFNKIISKHLLKKIKKNEKYKRLITKIKRIKLSTLVIIIALPFSPAFAINIAAGIANVDLKKFFVALLIGKISIIYFWGYISKSLLESITDINTLITIIIMLLLSYILTKLVNKKLKIE